MKILSLAALALGLGGCYSTGDGPDPTTALYFPVGLAVSPGGHALYVANSDFDLQFNAGTVETYELDDIRAFLKPIWSVDSSIGSADICADRGLGVNTTPILYPGPCGPLNVDAPPAKYKAMFDQRPPIQKIARIGAFATDLLYVCGPSGVPGPNCASGLADTRGARLFVPVRGDPSVTFFDVDDDRPGGTQSFKLDCGQEAHNGRCVDAHRIGTNASENSRGLTLPAEPFAIAVSDGADTLTVSHQIFGGGLSLIRGGDTLLDGKPRLEFVLGGLPAGTTGLAALPIPAVVSALGVAATNYQQGFVATYRGAAEADVFRVFDDQFAAPARPFLVQVGRFGLGATPNGLDSRSIGIDRSPLSAPRVQCENGCDPTDSDCLTKKNCTRIPYSIFLTNRSPSSLLVGELSTPVPTGSTDNVAFYESVPLAPGASRVVVGKITNTAGMIETRVFAVCFDARLIFIYDPVRRRVDGQIRTGRGPHALVMDPVEAIAYVGHFTDSYIGVIDLDQSHAGTYASIVATLGAPEPPADSK